jgi:iron(III) transport system permease protein
MFVSSRKCLHSGRIATVDRGSRRERERAAKPWEVPLLWLLFGVVIILALLPHIGVVMCSLARDWTGTSLPEWTLANYSTIFGRQSTLAATSIKVSLVCAFGSMLVDVVFGAALAFAIVRGRVWGRAFLDALALLPLALPGLILAFGLLAAFIHTPLSPIINSVPLLVIAYSIRRLPYAVRSVSAGLQQTSVALEEAALNLGASPARTVWDVTRPLVSANLLAAALLTFAFAVLEVSDSLILSLDSRTVPLAKAIYQLSIELSGGIYQACALGTLGMVLLTATFIAANRLLGKQLGALFRA